MKVNIVLFILIMVANVNVNASNDFLKHTISDFHDDADVFEYLQKGLPYNEIKRAYDLKNGPNEIIVTSAGRRMEGSETQRISNEVEQTDNYKKIGDYVLVARNGFLYSVLLNQKNEEAIKLISKVQIKQTDGFNGWYDDLLVFNQNVILVNHDGVNLNILFYTLSNEGIIEFDQDISVQSYQHEYKVNIIDENLVVLVDRYVDLKEALQEKTKSVSLVMEQVRQTIDTSSSNIETQHRLINTLSDINQSYEITDLLKCSLKELNKQKIKCNVTSLLGVSGTGFSFDEDAAYIVSSSERVIDFNAITESQYQDLLESRVLDSNDMLSTVYRIDLVSGDIGAVFIKGDLFRDSSFEVTDEKFVALLRNSVKNSDHQDVVGVHFNVKEFSSNVQIISNDNHQVLINKDNWVDANNFIEDYVFLSNSIDKYGYSSKGEVVIWNSKTNNVITAPVPYRVHSFFDQGENVLFAGNNKKKQLVIETWSLAGGAKKVSSKKYKQYGYAERNRNQLNSQGFTQGNIFPLAVERLNRKGEAMRYLKIRGRHTYIPKIIDIAYFTYLPNDKLKSIGVLSNSLVNIKKSCEINCLNSFDISKPILVDEYLYAWVNDELIKGQNKSGKIKTLNRLNLLNGQVSFE